MHNITASEVIERQKSLSTRLGEAETNSLLPLVDSMLEVVAKYA